MTLELLTAFLLFTLVGFITPGPNNIMLLTSGVHFGFRNTMPHIGGVAGGFALMTLVVGLGFDAVFKAYPALYTLLQVASVAYLLYLAWKIARSGPVVVYDDNTGKSPMSFSAACAFQWVNPKAWMMAVSAISIYVPHDHYFINLLIICFFFCLIGFPVASLWTSFGTMFRHLLADPKIAKIFNMSMALLLVASMAPVIGKML